MSYPVSLVLGVVVGAAYALLRVAPPAPPLVALVGLLGMLAGKPAARRLRPKPATNGATTAPTSAIREEGRRARLEQMQATWQT